MRPNKPSRQGGFPLDARDLAAVCCRTGVENILNQKLVRADDTTGVQTPLLVRSPPLAGGPGLSAAAASLPPALPPPAPHTSAAPPSPVRRRRRRRRRPAAAAAISAIRPRLTLRGWLGRPRVLPRGRYQIMQSKHQIMLSKHQIMQSKLQIMQSKHQIILSKH